jgi:hypothetical protein
MRKFRSGLPILITESAKSFASRRNLLHAEIQPNGVIERELVDDIAALTWEISRLRRLKSGIINYAFRYALQMILRQLSRRDDFASYRDYERAAEDLADRWFTDKDAKTEVAELFRAFQLDETAIEAEAFRMRADDLERLDRMLALATARRDKALYVLAEYRNSLAKALEKASDGVLEESDVPLLNVRSAS